MTNIDLGPTFEGICGDACNGLSSMHRADLILTSPPYFNQRTYTDSADEIGREDDPQTYADAVATAIYNTGHALTPSGSAWVNIGDTANQGTPRMVVQSLCDEEWGAWRLVDEVIWHKPNPNRRRVASILPSHEYLYRLTPNPDPYFDWLAAATPSPETNFSAGGSVWSIPLAGTKEAHGATYPVELAIKAIACGVSLGGYCTVCGTPKRREIQRERIPTRPGNSTKADGDAGQMGLRDARRHISKLIGWRWAAGCGCEAPFRRGVVLDPFIGSGTTAVAAAALGLDCIGIDINPSYIEIASKRFTDTLVPGRKPGKGEQRVKSHLDRIAGFRHKDGSEDPTKLHA